MKLEEMINHTSPASFYFIIVSDLFGFSLDSNKKDPTPWRALGFLDFSKSKAYFFKGK
jgi:hypothetical protein